MLYDLREPHVLFDCSYFIYNRAFTALTWAKDEFRFMHPYNHPTDIYDYDFMKHDEYMEFYESIFMKSVHNYIAQVNARPSRCIFAIDCTRSNIWRKSVYPAYKLNRDNKKNAPNFSGVFKYTYDILVPQLIREFGMHSIKVDGAEADDVICVASKQFGKDPNNKVWICSIDSDLSQLATDNVSVLPLNREEPIEVAMFEKFGTVNRYVMHKILSGDTSDNIPPIKARKMGDKTAMKVLDDPAMLKAFFTEHPEAIAQFKINRELVDLGNIPSDLVDTISNQLNAVIGKFK